MTGLQYARTMATLALWLTFSGCHFPGRTKTEPIPVPDPPKPNMAKGPTPVRKPSTEMPPPPPITQKVPEVETEVTKVIEEQPKPPKPKPKRKVVAKKLPPAPAVAAPDASPGPPEGTPIPKLGELITDYQRGEYLKACDQALVRAKQSLDQIKGVHLNHEQSESVERIKSFMSQAQQARSADPQTARQLAERADLLSRDLVRILR